jgi:NAD(P)H-dependent flavin oxidoreductase YrpB (nitropropane dioxygenase family)
MGRPVLRTPLCDLLGIEYPILLAGMGAGSGGSALAELVAAVSEAGGLGAGDRAGAGVGALR